MTAARILTEDVVARAARAAYREAGLEPGALAGTVAPLARLLRAYGLVADEVGGLSGERAAASLAVQAGRTLPEAGTAAPLSGYLHANAAGGWILVNRDDPLVRRRFSVAHELGHYVLHFLPLLAATEAGDGRDWVEFGESLPRAEDERDGTGAGRVTLDAGQLAPTPSDRLGWEAEAERFAALVLMPEAVVRARVMALGARGGSRESLARRLASELLVSQMAMRRRLADLALW
jgi:hypothetical protein